MIRDGLGSKIPLNIHNFVNSDRAGFAEAPFFSRFNKGTFV